MEKEKIRHVYQCISVNNRGSAGYGFEMVGAVHFKGCSASPFSLHRMLMREKGGKVTLNPSWN